jgi:HupE / UreJ protein
MRRWLGLLLAWPALAGAHPLAPALLELRESAPQRYEVLWRTTVAQVRGVEVAPELPASCTAVTPRQRAVTDGEALEARWSVHCEGGLQGQQLAVAGLDGSGINVVIRLEELNGAVVSGILDLGAPRFTVPARGTTAQRFGQYVRLGTGHLLTGLDHVLFVLGLLCIVSGARALVVTITSFTLGHSLTLAAAALGVVRFDAALAELGIALSLVAVAFAILRPAGRPSLLTRRPALLTFGFGLLHGFGFAGALTEVGLPQGEIAPALLAFNLGIEAGQLLLVAAALALLRLARIAPDLPRLSRAVPAYIIGSLAACWCIERSLPFLG